MNHNQCVPSWDLDDVGRSIQPQPVLKDGVSRSKYNSPLPCHDTYMSINEYEMAELIWENGQLTMLGIGQPRATNLGDAWIEKSCSRANDTLESLVNQGTHKLSGPLMTPSGACNFNTNTIQCRPMGKDALVPTDSKNGAVCSTRVGSCSVPTARVPGYSDWSVSESEQLRSMTTYGVTSTSFGASLDDTSVTLTVTVDDYNHDSVSHSMPQKGIEEEHSNEKKSTTKLNSSVKRSRVAAVHNQSERKRRDKINQRMKTLQKLVPKSNKTDKASMLDEVIEYMKQLQAQIHMLNTMRMPSMVMPLALQQQLQMSMMAPMGMGLGMGLNMDQMNMGINNAMIRPNLAGLPLPVMNPAAYMSFPTTSNGGDCIPPQAMTTMTPTDPLLSTYLASQSHPAMDAYNKVTSMYQHFQQQPSQNQGFGSNANR